MGLDNRDYLRDEQSRYSGGGFGGGGAAFGSNSPMCKRILIVTIVVYVLQMLVTRNWTEAELTDQLNRRIAMTKALNEEYGIPDDQAEVAIEQIESTSLKPRALGLPPQVSIVQDWMELDTAKVFKGQVWRLFTCAFLHSRDSPFHILFNMLFFWWFGPRLEQMYGSKEFLLFYLLSALVASAAFISIDLLSGDPVPMIGASGAVMAVTMLFAMHFPDHTIYLFFVLPVHMKWMVLIYAIMDLHPVLQVLSGDGLLATEVAHAAHLGGLAFGYIYWKKQMRLYPFVSGLETWWKAKRRGLRVVRPSVPTSRKSEKLADEMDAILRKISEQGEASLTKKERETLERASRELRDRKQ